MSLRPPPRPRPAAPHSGMDADGAFDAAIQAAETILNEALPRLQQLARDAEQTRQDLQALLSTLRETAESLRNPDGVRHPTPEVMDIEEASPLVTPPPRKSAPPAVGKVVPPPVPADALGETTDMGPRKTSPLEETSEMPQVPPREEWPAAKPPATEEEAIRFHCEKCGTKLSAPAKYVGKAASCKCGHRSTIPPKSTRARGGK